MSEPGDPQQVAGTSSGSTSKEVAGTSPGAFSESSGGGALAVTAGILASRLLGFLRERAFAYYFGAGPHNDVLRVALRAPNVLQNLLGEGTLSATFIPIYSRMVHEGRREEAGRFAGAIFGLLLAVAVVSPCSAPCSPSRSWPSSPPASCRTPTRCAPGSRRSTASPWR